MIEIRALRIYPVKSLGAIELESGALTVRGLKNDRMWMISDENFHFVTQRQIERLAAIKVSLLDDGLKLSYRRQSDLLNPLQLRKAKTKNFRLGTSSALLPKAAD